MGKNHDCSNTLNARTLKKRKHVTLTIQEKLDIIKCIEKGSSSRQFIATRFGIGKSTVHDIHKRRDQIRAFAAMHNSDDVYKRRRVDQKMSLSLQAAPDKDEFYLKDDSVTIMDSIEDFDYQEINEQDYEIVYEASLPSINEDSIEKQKTDPASELSMNVKSKRKSKTLTFREKYEVIMQIESGASVPQVCEAYGVGRTTVYDYMRRKDEIIDFIEKSNDVDRRTFKKSKYPEVENAVIEWCNARECYTKQEFYDFAKCAFDSTRDYSSSSNPVCCGSWSWAKRFFHRHPELREKLVTSLGSVDSRELTKIEYLNENNSSVNDKVGQDQNQSTNQLIKSLKISDKLLVLDEIDCGKSVTSIAEKFGVSMSTIYDIFRCRNELRDNTLTDNFSLRKMRKMPRYPQLELELLRWCLKLTNAQLTYTLIADKALCIFESLGLTGSFNPATTWAKKFVQRYPELKTKVETKIKEEIPDTVISSEENFIEEQEMIIENDEAVDMDHSFEFKDHSSTPDYEEEYIIEELDPQYEEETELSQEEEKPTNEQKLLTIIKNESPDAFLIPERIALKSLKILIKFSEEQGHTDILSHLVDFQTKLHENIS